MVVSERSDVDRTADYNYNALDEINANIETNVSGVGALDNSAHSIGGGAYEGDKDGSYRAAVVRARTRRRGPGVMR